MPSLRAVLARLTVAALVTSSLVAIAAPGAGAPAPAPAPAQPPLPPKDPLIVTQDEVDQGQVDFLSKQYVSAATHFARANELTPAPQSALDAALAADQGGTAPGWAPSTASTTSRSRRRVGRPS